MTSVVARLKQWASAMRRDLGAGWLATRDRRTPWRARIIAAITVAYALSPIDLVPDFIPVLGLLDDLLIVPLGLALALRALPPDLLNELRAAALRMAGLPRSRVAGAVIVTIWIAAGLAMARWLGVV